MGSTRSCCQPGKGGAYEKGGVEGEIGRFRRRHLVPIPVVATMTKLNEHLAQADHAEGDRHIGNRRTTVGADFAAERPPLQPLPAEPFDTARMLTARVDHKARICVRQCHYWVPARLAGWTVNVRLGATLSRSALAGESSPATNARSREAPSRWW